MTTPLASSSSPPERVAELDGVRGLAILLVVMMHGLYIAPAVGLDFSSPYARISMLGWCGVDVFFVLSGFLITGILLRSKGAPRYFRNFYARRALRIFPLYYVVIVLLLYVLPGRAAATGNEQASYFLYYQNFYFALSGADIDPARLITWSLAIEEQFYLVWPALVWMLPRRKLAAACAAMIVAAIGLRFGLLAAQFEGTHFLTPCRMDALAAGALLSVLPPPRAWFGGAATALGIGGLIGVAWFSDASRPETLAMQGWGLLFALLFGVGMLSLARTSTRLSPLFRLLLLRSLGKYSYCVYLVHFLVIDALTWYGYLKLPAGVQQWLRESPPATLVVFAFTLVCLFASWLVAFVSWHLFEKWFLALKRYFPSAG